MSKYSEIPPERFVDEAEKILRVGAEKKGLAVWRGRCTGFLFPRDQEMECVLVGLPDENNPPAKSSVEFALSIDRNGTLQFDRGDFSARVPFGGGWHPLIFIELQIATLPDLS